MRFCACNNFLSGKGLFYNIDYHMERHYKCFPCELYLSFAGVERHKNEILSTTTLIGLGSYIIIIIFIVPLAIF